MWKAFDELEAIGWIGSKRPRMVAVQSRTCAPIVRAMEQGTEFAVPWNGGHTSVPGLRVPFTIGDFLILRVLRESNGFGVAIDDAEVEPARAEFGAGRGHSPLPRGRGYLSRLQDGAGGRPRVARPIASCSSIAPRASSIRCRPSRAPSIGTRRSTTARFSPRAGLSAVTPRAASFAQPHGATCGMRRSPAPPRETRDRSETTALRSEWRAQTAPPAGRP